MIIHVLIITPTTSPCTCQLHGSLCVFFPEFIKDSRGLFKNLGILITLFKVLKRQLKVNHPPNYPDSCIYRSNQVILEKDLAKM
jgi:hypothetical protein